MAIAMLPLYDVVCGILTCHYHNVLKFDSCTLNMNLCASENSELMHLSPNICFRLPDTFHNGRTNGWMDTQADALHTAL